MYRLARWLMVAAFVCVARAQSVYEKDVAFALDELEKQCGSFFELKHIVWKDVRKQFESNAAQVKSDQDHLILLTRLLARLKDGHAAVLARGKTNSLTWPVDGAWKVTGARVGPGMFLCRIGSKIYVKTSWGATAETGVKPGMELVAVDGEPVADWLEHRIAFWRDLKGFSTDQQEFFFACHGGLARPVGTRLELDLETVDGKRMTRMITYSDADPRPWGPSAFPRGLESSADLRFALLKSGFGYIHVRRSKETLPEQIDRALETVGAAPGLVIDFRANTGGGCDHDAFMGRFVPQGETLHFAKTYASAGPHPYAGPIVVIVDATCVSAGETTSGILEEDGRAYMIGESATAGMSSQKTTIELPSGLFGLYVSVASNKGRFNGGKGIEGIGVVPHEIVEYSREDLAAGVDTLIARAEALLANFPNEKVPYQATR